MKRTGIMLALAGMAVLVSGSSFGQAEEYIKYPFESYDEGVLRMLQDEIAQKKASAESVIKESKRLDAIAAAAQAKLKAETEELEKYEMEKIKAEQEFQAAAKEQEQKLAAAAEGLRKRSGFFGFFKPKSESVREMERATKEAAEKERANQKLGKRVDSLTSAVVSYTARQEQALARAAQGAEKRAAAEAEKAHIEMDRTHFANMTHEQLREQVLKDSVMDAAVRKADRAYQNQQKTAFDARLLLTDLNRLRGEMKHEAGISALKYSAVEALRNSDTAIGAFVNEQIASAMKGICAHQDRCAAGKANDIYGEVMRTLSSNVSKAKVQENGGEKKTGETSPLEPAPQAPAPAENTEVKAGQ